MSNVLYRCPHGMETIVDEDEVETRVFKCSAKLFALPGRTRIQCHRHPDTYYIQVEDASGPDFLFIDEDGETRSKDRILPGEAHGAGVARIVAEPDPTTEPGPSNVLLGDLMAARSAYRMLTGEEADGRWGLGRIQSAVEAIMEERGLNVSEPEDESAREGNSEENDEVKEVDNEPTDENEVETV